MKKVAVIFLFSCLIAPFVAKYISLDVLKSRLRKEVKHHIAQNTDPENLVTIIISHKDSQRLLKWIHAREFEFNGCMFDIVHAEFTGDSVKYVCWPDHMESQLNRQLAGLLAIAVTGSPVQRESKNQWEKFSKSFVFVLPDTSSFSEFITGQTLSTGVSKMNYPEVSVSPPAPPPKSPIIIDLLSL